MKFTPEPEALRVRSFCGLQNVDLHLSNFNIVIGPQATGKSICAKLLYFFRQIPFLYIFGDVDSYVELENEVISEFRTYFPETTWCETKFSIRYSIGQEFVEVARATKRSKLNLEVSEGFSKAISAMLDGRLRRHLKEDAGFLTYQDYVADHRNRNEILALTLSEPIRRQVCFRQVYVPSGRIFYANTDKSVLAFLASKKSLDPFLIEFGKHYDQFEFRHMSFRSHGLPKVVEQRMKVLEPLIEELLSGIPRYEDRVELIEHKDGRKINIALSSSGQQEIYPLTQILRTLAFTDTGERGTTIYIEEPEAHLYPLSQRRVTELLVAFFNMTLEPVQLFVTTHSPYILTTLNNLMRAGRIRSRLSRRAYGKLYSVVPKPMVLDPAQISAYYLAEGEARSIIDQETELIDASFIDSVSDELTSQFDQLLDFEGPPYV